MVVEFDYFLPHMTQERRRVLVTGGSGFIARALYGLCLSQFWSQQEFFALSRDDGKLRYAHERFDNLIDVARCDVSDEAGVATAIKFIAPDTVIHAAAAKYVDVSERNAWDTVRVNLTGTMNVARAIERSPWVTRAIFISTDKACQPVNTYGGTKFLGERLWQESARVDRETGREWVVVRYGNVIGSTGSALPRFRQWAKEGKRVQVTNPDHTRFWLHPHEALHTLLTAMTGDGLNGLVVLPAYARASTLITAVHGAVGNMDAVELVGERPGEKVDELMCTEREAGRARFLRAAGLPYWCIPDPAASVEAQPGRHELSSRDPLGGPISASEISEALDFAEGV